MTKSADLRRRSAESRVRLAAVAELRAQYELVLLRSRDRLDASRRLLGGRTPSGSV